MERKELLGFIKNHEDLKQIIAEKEGKNYTNVKTTILAKYVDEYNNSEDLRIILQNCLVSKMEVY